MDRHEFCQLNEVEKFTQVCIQIDFINMGVCDESENVYNIINNMLVDIIFESI